MIDEEDDFFSFFGSHEKIIMKPESNFKNLRSFLTSLPIDYYILLQEGYQLTTPEFKLTNYIMMKNVPLLSKKKSFFKPKQDLVKTILMEDIYRCVDRREAESFLSDTYAEEELVRHLQDRYGLIDESFLINYNIEKLMQKIKDG